MVWYPSPNDIVEINRKVIQDFKVKKKDRHDVLSGGYSRLDKITEDLKTRRGNIKQKAGFLVSRLTKDHPFASGNRRTAIWTGKTFFFRNTGIIVSSPPEKTEKLLKKIRYGTATEGDMGDYFR